MTVETPTSVHYSVDVAAPIDHTFKVFTEQMYVWWDPTHHLLDNVVEMRVDQYVGGRITDVDADGTTQSWSRILAFEPPTTFAFSWDIDVAWEIESDPGKCSEIWVSFEPIGDSSTRVSLDHRHLDRHGDGWEGMASAMTAPGAWGAGLARLAKVAAG